MITRSKKICIHSNGSGYPFGKKSCPFERLPLAIQKKSSPVWTANVIRLEKTNCQLIRSKTIIEIPAIWTAIERALVFWPAALQLIYFCFLSLTTQFAYVKTNMKPLQCLILADFYMRIKKKTPSE